ncbi:MAG TPA: hypothetical protein DCW57_03910 [Planctomycetaceae bacterium]|nr:hypothetical protein [Planctomycetaceae bacterium]
MFFLAIPGEVYPEIVGAEEEASWMGEVIFWTSQHETPRLRAWFKWLMSIRSECVGVRPSETSADTVHCLPMIGSQTPYGFVFSVPTLVFNDR